MSDQPNEREMQLHLHLTDLILTIIYEVHAGSYLGK